MKLIKAIICIYDTDVNFKDKNSQTLLHLAIRHGHVEIKANKNSKVFDRQILLIIMVNTENYKIMHIIINQIILSPGSYFYGIVKIFRLFCVQQVRMSRAHTIFCKKFDFIEYNTC